MTSQPRMPWSRSWLEGAGAAILLAPGLLWLQLSQSHVDAFHRLLPLTTVTRALAVDLALLSLASMMVIRGLEAQGAHYTTIAARRSVPVPVWAMWFGLLAARAVAGMIVAQVLWWQQITTARAFLLVAIPLTILWLTSVRGYDYAVRALRFVVLLAGFCLFWMIPALIVASLAHQPHDEAQFRKPLPAVNAPHRRIVWLLFDEMSYDQTFAHRWPGLDLPNLDALRAQSVTFSDVQPDGFYTEDVIPSMFLGKPINDVRGTAAGWMIYQSVPHGSWQPFDGNQTLFADAQRDGWTTGALGEYNPYCRILKDQLDSCWMGMPPLPDHFSRDKSTLGNVIAPIAADLDRIAGHRARLQAPAASPDASPLDALGPVRHGRALIGDEAIDLCFLHLPMPHPPGSYDRKTGRIGASGSYIDNLAMADRVLGLLMADLAKTGDAQQTTVILSSDHSWRVWLWRNTFGWTREDELASGHGHFDPRPMLMIRFPGQNAPKEISHPVPLLGMHDLIEQMMTGQIENQQQLDAWAAQQK